METPTRKTPGRRARELYESGTIDGAQYEAIVSADRRFQKEEARWQAEVEAHYGAAPPAADWTLCGGGTVDAAYPPGPPPLMVPVAVQENAYVSGKGWKHGCASLPRRRNRRKEDRTTPLGEANDAPHPDVVAVPVASLGGSDAAVRDAAAADFNMLRIVQLRHESLAL